MKSAADGSLDPRLNRIRHLRAGVVGSLLAVTAFIALVALGGVFGFGGSGRGSEPAMFANAIGPALILLAGANVGQAFGFSSVMGGRLLSKATAATSLATSVLLAVLGAILLVDRVPCDWGLYCNGQVLGIWANWAYFLWVLVPCVSGILIGGLMLEDMALRRHDLAVPAAILLIADGFVFGFAVVGGFGIFLAAIGLGATANGILAGMFIQERGTGPIPVPLRT